MAGDYTDVPGQRRTGEMEQGAVESVYGELWLHGLSNEQVDYILANLRRYLRESTALERELWRRAADELWLDAQRGERSTMLHRVAGQFGKLVNGELKADSAEGHEVWVLAHGLAMLKEKSMRSATRTH